MPARTTTRLYRLIEERIEGSLADFIAARWPTSGWRTIAAELTEITDIEITGETLRNWFADRIHFEVRVS
jgi:hypothetical protein